MDLGAYAQIPNISDIAKANGIHVPRLRGYRLMKNEKPMINDDIKDFVGGFIAMDLVHACPFWCPNAHMYEYSRDHEEAEKRYTRVVSDQDGKPREVPRWENIHGWKRKVLKRAIHSQMRKLDKQAAVWNNYVGRDDVLYVHARIGGFNWRFYKDEVCGELLDRIDDAWDKTYCDLYFKIKGENYGSN